MDNDQPSFTDIEYGNRRRVSRREAFLETMDTTIPWDVWVGLIEPHYYAAGPGKRGRKAKPIATMLRMYLLQVWFSLSDEGVEEAIYDSCAMRRFMGLDFAVEQVPDATTLLHFRHLLEKHRLARSCSLRRMRPCRARLPALRSCFRMQSCNWPGGLRRLPVPRVERRVDRPRGLVGDGQSGVVDSVQVIYNVFHQQPGSPQTRRQIGPCATCSSRQRRPQ